MKINFTKNESLLSNNDLPIRLLCNKKIVRTEFLSDSWTYFTLRYKKLDGYKFHLLIDDYSLIKRLPF